MFGPGMYWDTLTPIPEVDTIVDARTTLTTHAIDLMHGSCWYPIGTKRDPNHANELTPVTRQIVDRRVGTNTRYSEERTAQDTHTDM